MDNGEIIGYLASLPARKELFDAILNEVLIDDVLVIFVDIGVYPMLFKYTGKWFKGASGGRAEQK